MASRAGTGRSNRADTRVRDRRPRTALLLQAREVVAVPEVRCAGDARLTLDEHAALFELLYRRRRQHRAVQKRQSNRLRAEVEWLAAEVHHEDADGSAFADLVAGRDEPDEGRGGSVVYRLNAGMADQHLAVLRLEHHAIAPGERPGREES